MFSIVMEWTAVLKGHLADGKVCVCVCRRFIIPACWKRLSERRAIITQRDWWQRLWVWETALLMDHPVSHFIPFKKKKEILPHLPSRQSRSLLFLYIHIFPLFFFLFKRETEERKKSWFTPQRKQAAVCLRFPSSMRHNRSVCFPVEPIMIILFSDCGRVDQQSQVVLRFSVFPLALANYRRVVLNKTFCETTAAGPHLQFATK